MRFIHARDAAHYLSHTTCAHHSARPTAGGRSGTYILNDKHSRNAERNGGRDVARRISTVLG
ncbi:MAG: hypothetical protein MJZ46_01160 [Bacteroidales bacterium]|nr:hypothetical protein [Bacteroidales bacterium]